MTINRSTTEELTLTLGTVIDLVELTLTKTATNRVTILNPTIISSSLRYLKITANTSDLDKGEYIMDVKSDSTTLKSIKVDVIDQLVKTEHDSNRTYSEYNG